MNRIPPEFRQFLAAARPFLLGLLAFLVLDVSVAQAMPWLTMIAGIGHGYVGLGVHCHLDGDCVEGQSCEGLPQGGYNGTCCISPGGSCAAPGAQTHCCTESSDSLSCSAATGTCCVQPTDLVSHPTTYPPGGLPLACSSATDCCPAGAGLAVECTSAYNGLMVGTVAGTTYCVELTATGRQAPNCNLCASGQCLPGTTQCCIGLYGACILGGSGGCCPNGEGAASVCYGSAQSAACCTPGGSLCTIGDECCSGTCTIPQGKTQGSCTACNAFQ